MNALGVATLVLLALWLGVLTVVALLLVRQVALLSVRLSSPGSAFSLANEGPEIGSVIPHEVASALKERTKERVDLVFLSATCTPCRELAAALGERALRPSVTALIPGPPELASALANLLPSGVSTVSDPDATRLIDALGIQSMPFAVSVERGRVTGKTHVQGESDLVSFIQGDGLETNGEVARRAEEVADVR